MKVMPVTTQYWKFNPPCIESILGSSFHLKVYIFSETSNGHNSTANIKPKPTAFKYHFYYLRSEI